MRVRSFCHARLPRAGLGNKLLVWAKALVFSRLNDLPLVVTGWHNPQKDSFLRAGDARMYLNSFKSRDDMGWFQRALASRWSSVVSEPAVEKMQVDGEGRIFEFSAVPHWADYFGDVRDYREEVRIALYDLLTPTRRREIDEAESPVICVHVRHGDFRRLTANEDFAKVGGVRTPFSYFISLIESIRKIHGRTLPVLVMSDGSPSDLADLLALPETSLSPKASAITDICVMAKSRVLITSAGSTFSYWAGFLGESALIHHPDHVHAPIRPANVNSRFYEGPLAGSTGDWSPLFLKNLGDIQTHA